MNDRIKATVYSLGKPKLTNLYRNRKKGEKLNINLKMDMFRPNFH